MSLQTDKFKVGVFLLCSGVLFLAFLAFVVGKGLLRSNREYRISFKETVKGLVPGAAVNYHGVPVGSVGKMWLDGNTTVVMINVDPERATVQESVTRAAMERNPVTGLATVELEGWKAGAAELEAGCEIPADPSWGSEVLMTFPKLMKEIPKTLVSINQAAQALRDLLGGDLSAKVHGVLGNLDTLSAKLPDTVGNMERDTRAALASIKRTVDDLSGTLAKLNGHLEGVAGDTRTALATAGETMKEARSTMRAGRKLLEGREIKETLTAIRNAAGSLDRTVKSLQGTAAGVETSVVSVSREITPLAEQLSVLASRMARLADLLGDNPSALVWGNARGERAIPAARPSARPAGRTGKEVKK